MKNNTFEYKQIVNSLTDEWDEMNSSLYYSWSKDNTKYFKKLIRKTHKFFLPYCGNGTLPKESISILLLMNQFSNSDEPANNFEINVRDYQRITKGLINAIISEDNNYLYKQGKFYVLIDSSKTIFDINNFSIGLDFCLDIDFDLDDFEDDC